MSAAEPRVPPIRPGGWPNIVLVGARASGKSRASRQFAEDTGWTRVSTDERFEEAHGPIPEFVARRGWEAFRDEESRVLASISGERLVVDCGGGVVERRENREAIRRLGTAYWVRAPLVVLESRLARPKHRSRRPPLLPGSAADADPAGEAARILERRAPLYRSVADRDIWSAAPGAGEEPAPRLAADALRAAHFGPGIALSVAAPAPERAAAGLLAAWAEAGPDDLLEWRLDALDRPEGPDRPDRPDRPDLESVRSVLGALPAAALDRLIVTARPREEGGSFRGDEAAQIDLLVEAARLGAGWLDIEAEADRRASPRISERARRARPEVRLIASRHWFDEAPEDPETQPSRLAAMRPDLVKVAVRVRDFAETAALHRRIRSHAAERRADDRLPPLVAVAMGEAGEALRVTARAAGARFSTYAPPAGWPETAPGQSDSARIRARHRRWGAKLASPAPLHGVVGFPVAQSLSPAMHEAAFRHLGMEAAYLPFEVPPEDLAAFLSAARLAGAAGLNLTIPHKEAAVPLLDRLDEDAARIGAVNTILPADDGLLGANTDWIGAARALEEALGEPLAGKRASVIGAGGSARAVLHGLRRSGAEATVFARDEARGAACAARFGAGCAPLDRLRGASADLLVNATPVGMAGGPAEGQSPASAEVVAAHEVVFDLVFHPRRTPLLELAAAAGKREVSGLRMLVLQGAAAFTRWTGRPAPLAVMARAAERADDAR